MDLFSPDREATQLIEELSSQSVRALPSQEDSKYHQWIFEICKIEPAVRHTMSPFALLDAFLTSIQLAYDCETHLREVDQAVAREILIYILSQTLAYDMPTGLQEHQVVALVGQLFQIFSVHPRYFTNADFTLHPFRQLSSYSLTGNTFDTGLILLDEQRVGILWATDED